MIAAAFAIAAALAVVLVLGLEVGRARGRLDALQEAAAVAREIADEYRRAARGRRLYAVAVGGLDPGIDGDYRAATAALRVARAIEIIERDGRRAT